jgi:hypothetical protein
MPLPKRLAALLLRDYAVLTYLSIGYPSLWGRYKLVTHPSATDQEVTQKGGVIQGGNGMGERKRMIGSVSFFYSCFFCA